MNAVLLTCGIFAIGWGAAAALSPRSARPDRLIAAFPLGAGLFTLSLFVLNQAAGFPLRAAAILALLAAEAAAALLAARLSPRSAGGPVRGPARGPLTRLARFELFLLLLVLSMVCVTGALVPVPYWDVNSEYLPLTKQMFLDRTIPWDASPAAAELVRAFPPGHTMLIGAGWIALGAVSHLWARVLSPLYGCLLIALLWRAGRRRLGLSAETVLGGLVLCATLPLLYEVMIVPTGTVPFCFHAVAALCFILESLDTADRRPLALAGVFLGLSYWTSYTGAVLIACFAALCVVLAALRRVLPEGARCPDARGLALMLGAALLIAAPHMIRNAVLLGDPLYPALYRWVGGAWIDDWSIAHLIPRVVPAHRFYLRLRWEIFHEGFLIYLLFFFSLFSLPWCRTAVRRFLALFCLAYACFYLSFLTWPRTSGISTKLLLPSMIPACLFAGERLDGLLRGRLRPWQWAALLCLIPVWSALMLRDEMLIPTVLPLRPPLRAASVARAAQTFFFDFDEALLWVAAAGCLAGALARSAALRRISAAAFLLVLAARPLSDGASHLAVHVATWNARPGYSFFNAPILPHYLPERDWLDRRLPPDAVIATFDNRVYIYPRRVVALDTPALWPLYRGMGLDEGMALLRRNGITHICLYDFLARLHPLSGKAAFFSRLGDPAYLPLVYGGAPGQEAGHSLRVYAVAPPRGGTP